MLHNNKVATLDNDSQKSTWNKPKTQSFTNGFAPSSSLFTNSFTNNSSTNMFVPKIDAQAAAGEKVQSTSTNNLNYIGLQNEYEWIYGPSNFNHNDDYSPFSTLYGNASSKVISPQSNKLIYPSETYQSPLFQNHANGSQLQNKGQWSINYSLNSVKKQVPYPAGSIGMQLTQIKTSTPLSQNKQIAKSVQEIKLTQQQAQIEEQDKDSDSDSMSYKSEYKSSYIDDDSYVSQQSSDFISEPKKAPQQQKLFINQNQQQSKVNNIFVNKYETLLKNNDEKATTNLFKTGNIKPNENLFALKKQEIKPINNFKDLIDLQQKSILASSYQIIPSQTKKQEEKNIFSNNFSQTIKMQKVPIRNPEQCETLKQRVKQLEQLNKQYLTVIESLTQTVKNLSIVHKMSSMIKPEQATLIKKSPDNEKIKLKVSDQSLKKKNLFDDSEDD